MAATCTGVVAGAGVDELPESPPPPHAAKRVAMQAANNALWFVSISIPSFKFNF